MRALLLAGVLWLWLACLVAAVALPVVLVLQLRHRRRAPGAAGEPSRSSVLANRTTVALLGGFAVVMVAGAAVLGGVIATGDGVTDVDVGEVTPWVALPLWSATMAASLAVVLARARRDAARSGQRVRGSMR